MRKKVFEGIIGTNEVKVSVEVQQAETIQLKGEERLIIEFSDEIYKDYPQGKSILLRCVPDHYPILFSGGKVHVLTSEGLKEVSMANPFVKKEA